MALKPEASVMAGLATAAVVVSIHSVMHPPVADIQGLPAGNPDVDLSEKKATWTSAGVVAGVSLLAKDPTIFIIGSVATIIMAFLPRHANWTESKSSMMNIGQKATSAVSGNDLSAGPQMTVQDVTMFQNTSEFVSS